MAIMREYLLADTADYGGSDRTGVPVTGASPRRQCGTADDRSVSTVLQEPLSAERAKPVPAPTHGRGHRLSDSRQFDREHAAAVSDRHQRLAQSDQVVDRADRRPLVRGRPLPAGVLTREDSDLRAQVDVVGPPWMDGDGSDGRRR